MQYLYIVNGVIHWNTEGYFKKTIENEDGKIEKRKFSSQKGSLNLHYVQSITLTFDSISNEFSVSLFFNGNEVFFTTKDPIQADNLYDIVHWEHYGFSLEDINSCREASVPLGSGISGSSTTGTTSHS